MFFDNLGQIPTIAQRTNCTIFVVAPDTEVNLPHTIYIRPTDEKKSAIISVDQIRELISMTGNCETSERYFIITPADAMNEAAQNAFLKTFEEPKEHYHFILLTEHPAALLPTILSRAQIFFLKNTGSTNAAPKADAETITEAKRLIAAKPTELYAIAEEYSKIKTRPRERALEIIATAIELLYKTYFKTGNAKFLTKVPHLIRLYNNLSNNGHLKLHLVADLL